MTDEEHSIDRIPVSKLHNLADREAIDRLIVSLENGSPTPAEIEHACDALDELPELLRRGRLFATGYELLVAGDADRGMAVLRRAYEGEPPSPPKGEMAP